MKKARRMFGILVIALVAITMTVGLVACDKGNLDENSRAFSMSIQTPDGVFNPFFSTSAYDSSIIALTQISMFNTDKEGNLTAGLTEPTVVLDWNQQSVLDDGTITTEESNAAYTDYELVIKNGLKFSDGSDLTIKDVLFNLYVYLDPVFTGSATIYSTDIVGLNAYRTQDLSASEASAQVFEERFYTTAQTKLNNLIAWVRKYTGVDDKDNPGKLPAWDDMPNWDGNYDEYTENQNNMQIKMTFEKYRGYVDSVASAFMEELVSDWNAINMEDYNKKPEESVDEETNFTEPWQVFLLNDIGNTDILKRRDGDSGPFIKTPNGRYILDTAKAQSEFDGIVGDDIKAMPEGAEKQNAIKDAFIKSCFSNVFRTYQTYTDSYGVVKYHVTVPSINHVEFENVVNYWGTAATVMDKFVAEAKSDYFGDENAVSIPNISGITVYKTDTFHGTRLNGEHYVLHIRINKVDPKALMNFSFTVAPMHYYSNKEQIELFNTDWTAWENAGAKENEFNEYVTHFGVQYANSEFMEDTVNSSSKVKLPVGGGAYQASNFRGETAGITGDDFYDGGMIYYTRNEYFWTLGADGGSQENSQMHNAYIKNVLYKVIASDQIISSLTQNNIDFGDPGATQENEQLLKDAGLEVVKTMTAGYGYIGINPRYIPEVGVRRAIMKAMNIQDNMIDNYYKGGFADPIYRPMSLTSWAYPKGAGVYSWGSDPNDHSTDLTYDENGSDIRKLVENSGYHLNASGLWENNTTGKTLDIKFTIAGSSTDHPAYSCFLNAQKILNANGFNVQVVTSAQALSDLSAGKLAVWAAAWSSAIDPDMYQVYHINSQASSTSNWGYKQIKADTKKYSFEYGVIDELSDLIDAARETSNKDTRKDLYAQCLDKVMELAVELPTYQRRDIAAYNAKVIDKNSLPKHNSPNPKDDQVSPYYGLLSRIWDVRYVH